MKVHNTESVFQASPVVLLTSVVLLLCLSYLGYAILISPDADMPAISSVTDIGQTDKTGVAVSVLPSNTVSDHDAMLPSTVAHEAGAAEPAGISVYPKRSVQPPRNVMHHGRDSGNHGSAAPVLYFSGGGASDPDMAGLDNADSKSRQPRSFGYSGRPQSAAVLNRDAGLKAASTASAGQSSVSSASTSEAVSEAADKTSDNVNVSENNGADATADVYSEVMAEVQIDLDEVQKIRCYPVGAESDLPCMCEFTIIKEGRVRTDLIDNCN